MLINYLQKSFPKFWRMKIIFFFSKRGVNIGFQRGVPEE